MAVNRRMPTKRRIMALSLGACGLIGVIWATNMMRSQPPLSAERTGQQVRSIPADQVASSNLDALLSEQPRPWLLAQSLPLEGPSGHIGERFSLGIDTVLRDVNQRGGIAGRPVKIWRLNDGYEPDQALRNTHWFAEEPTVLALFGYFGTPTSHAALPVAQAAGLSLIAPLTGASSLRSEGQSSVLHFRASYAEEAKRIVDHLVNDGFIRIGVAYQNDAYGKDVLASTLAALKAHGLEAIATAPLPRNSMDTDAAAKTLATAKPDALVVISLSKTMASLVNNLHRLGSRPQLMTVSPTGTKALFKDLPQAAAYGVGVTQIVPFPWDGRHPAVALYQKLLRQHQPDVDFDFISLEGFMAARWLVNAMEAVAPQITRERLSKELLRTTPGLHRSVDLIFLGSDPWEP